VSSQIAQVLRFYEVLWDAHDRSAIPTVLHESVTFRGSLGLEKSGHDGFAEYTDFVHTSLADFRCIVDDIVGDGNTVFAKMVFRGRHKARLLNYEPTGKSVEWSGCARFIFDGDLISDIWVLGDLEGLKSQLEANKT